MRFGKTTAAMTALGILVGATAAYAQDPSEPASTMGCLHMQKKVSAALETNQQSPNYSAARQQAQGAQGWCAQGQFKLGVDGYAKALELLGAS